MSENHEEHAYRHMVAGPHPHLHSVWLYWGIFFCLVGLTVVTVWVAQFDFGEMSIVVAMAVACVKASLVFCIFMHLWWDSKFYALILSTTMIFLGLFLLFPLLDVDSRNWVDPKRDNFIPRNEKIYEYQRENPKALPQRPGLKEADEGDLIFIAPGHH